MEKLKMYRFNHHYSCQQMANNLGISKSFYWQVENNKRKLSYDLAYKIANVFKIKPDELFYEEYDNDNN